MSFTLQFPYPLSPVYNKRIAYFCMEYGIHQPLKTYAGGLGFLAGSHMRSAFEMGMSMVGIGVLWKYGYYDQTRKQDQTMDVLFMEKIYGFLQDTGIRFTIQVSQQPVWVAAWYLPPETFQTAPVFFLSTDLPENDYLSRTICHRLYDANPESRIASAILLGEGGARLLEALNWLPDIYHLNESHALPLGFYLYRKWGNLAEVKKHLVFTNHTPEPGGNERSHLSLLQKLGFFGTLPMENLQQIACVTDGLLDHTLTALRLAGKANAVSQKHATLLCQTGSREAGTCPIIGITNAQSFSYWHHAAMYRAMQQDDDLQLLAEKKQCKKQLFELVADQCGEIYDDKIFTLIFAKRFGGYKRPELLLNDPKRLHRLLTNPRYPILIIWAGKPYPMDFGAIAVFDNIVHLSKTYTNCAALVGYELSLSRLLKAGADGWLNVPRMGHEASGTSGMSAAMNGAVNISIPDGWYPEFVRDAENGFVIPASDPILPLHQQDELDAQALYDLLENKILPLYYDDPKGWLQLMKQGMRDIVPKFDSHRMAREYYEELYS